MRQHERAGDAARHDLLRRLLVPRRGLARSRRLGADLKPTLALGLAVGTLGCALLVPPLVEFEPQRAPALLLAALGSALLLLPLWLPWRDLPTQLRGVAERVGWAAVSRSRGEGRGIVRSIAPRAGLGMRVAGAAILWGVLLWSVFSQASPLTGSRGQVWAQRALPLTLLLAAWLAFHLPWDWQRRGLVGIALPSLLALGVLAWPTPPRILDFAPYYLALDSHGTLYASDAHASVIRVFAPDGSLVAKLRPGLASRAGPPGIGFSPPGPYNDPDRLGVARATPGARGISASLRPWPVGADDFWFCGMAVGAGDRLFVPDWMRGRLLRFAPDGRLEASWPLPAGYQPSLGCVTVAGTTVYLADTRGTLLQLDARDGQMIGTRTIGEPILGGICATPAGDAVYALARSRVYRLDPRLGTQPGSLSSWPLPPPSGPLGQPYQAILALGDGRVLVANLAARRVDVYAGQGAALGSVGRRGSMPGEFGQVGGLARDDAGRLYVADSDSRVVQRFTPAGQISALYWSPDDDEID